MNQAILEMSRTTDGAFCLMILGIATLIAVVRVVGHLADAIISRRQ